MSRFQLPDREKLRTLTDFVQSADTICSVSRQTFYAELAGAAA